jgi:hypothetical protein
LKNAEADKKKPHIKKPLNAFMLYMKEMRAQVSRNVGDDLGSWLGANESKEDGLWE